MSVVAVSKISCFTEISDIPRNKKTNVNWEGSAILRDLNQQISEDFGVALCICRSTGTFWAAILRKHNPQIPLFYLLLQRGNSTKSLSSIDLIFRLDRYLEKTIRSAVEQHLFDVHGSSGQSSEDSEAGTSSASSNVSARQRRRHHKEQEEARRNRDMYEPGFFVLENIFKSTAVISSYQGNAAFCYERH